MVSKAAQLALRGIEFVWTLLVMALIGNMLDLALDGNPSTVNYCMFCAAFSMVSLFYLIPAEWSDSYIVHVGLPALIDALNVIFFFCAGIALAAKLGAHSCTNSAYTHSNKITSGASNTKHRCREAQAATAFLWFAFACYVVSFVLSLMSSRGSGGVNLRGGVKGGPAMSQV